jgi:hypothetical protein
VLEADTSEVQFEDVKTPRETVLGVNNPVFIDKHVVELNRPSR